ncbi:ATPase [Maridesulfovibrio ferrireducens]|uniref:F0F1 ATP synthase subunit B family protein n=1 Tax=Maridesulfovibrio ferrireducens TaxID=246191 RepID=UPI001A18567D|nr:ATPase [Maridesulfovibrio ferrireducens]MBI9113117.1 ATPase [Maridesulfovibrio ferrireducens]
MLLDWFTVFAQIINFFVLIFLLKLFLYGPLVKAMKKRKERVADEMEQVRKAKSEADELNKSLQAKHLELENKASEVMTEIHSEAEKWRQQAMISAQKEIDIQREEWLSALSREKDVIALNLKKRIMDEVTSVASRIILDLSDSNLEERVVAGLLRIIEMESVKVDCRENEIIIRTGFAHEGVHREKTVIMLNKLFPDCAEHIFKVEPELGFGIELVAGDRKWEWNLTSYVGDLEKNILEEIAKSPSGVE